MKLQERLRQMAEELWVEANNLDRVGIKNAVEGPYRSGSNQAEQGYDKEYVGDRNVVDEKFNPEVDVDAFANNLRMAGTTAQLRLIAKHDVAEFKLRKRVEQLESTMNAAKQKLTFDREWLGDLEERVTKMVPELRAVSEAVRAALTPDERFYEWNLKLNYLERNVKTCMKMFESLEVKIGVLKGATPSLLELKTTNETIEKLTRRVKALETRMAKDWDKKRR